MKRRSHLFEPRCHYWEGRRDRRLQTQRSLNGKKRRAFRRGVPVDNPLRIALFLRHSEAPYAGTDFKDRDVAVLARRSLRLVPALQRLAHISSLARKDHGSRRVEGNFDFIANRIGVFVNAP